MVSVTTTAAMGRHLMPWVNNTVRLSLNPSRMIPRRNSLLEISPAASFTPDLCSAERLEYHLRIGNWAAMPMSNAMISAPNRLNPGNCLSHEATSEAAKVTMPTKTISLVAMRAHHVLQKSITCLKCSGRFGHRYGAESDDFSAVPTILKSNARSAAGTGTPPMSDWTWALPPKRAAPHRRWTMESAEPPPRRYPPD